MSNACNPILVGVAFLVLEIKLAFNIGQISLSNLGLYSPCMGVKKWNKKLGIGSKIHASRHDPKACTPILVGMAFLVFGDNY